MLVARFLTQGETDAEAAGREQLLREHIVHSDSLIGVWADDTLLALIGAVRATLISDTAYLWMINTPALADHRVAFIRLSRKIRAMLFFKYDTLIGLSLTASSMRWLEWHGVEYGETLPSGESPFIMRRPENG